MTKIIQFPNSLSRRADARLKLESCPYHVATSIESTISQPRAVRAARRSRRNPLRLHYQTLEVAIVKFNRPDADDRTKWLLMGAEAAAILARELSRAAKLAATSAGIPKGS